VGIKASTPIPAGFSRTDLAFGDSLNFGPNQPVLLASVIIVDHELGRRLRAMHLKLVRMDPVET
jgi:hypothetical protein